jgi:hypothetical protein
MAQAAEKVHMFEEVLVPNSVVIFELMWMPEE